MHGFVFSNDVKHSGECVIGTPFCSGFTDGGPDIMGIFDDLVPVRPLGGRWRVVVAVGGVLDVGVDAAGEECIEDGV